MTHVWAGFGFLWNLEASRSLKSSNNLDKLSDYKLVYNNAAS
jgi:hypothetical protein